ncbi:MAG: Uncharacterised protein [Polaribacter sejongensis]|nr:MAG: Uncharacterised protein [Polaribacter sejongensis]
MSFLFILIGIKYATEQYKKFKNKEVVLILNEQLAGFFNSKKMTTILNKYLSVP